MVVLALQLAFVFAIPATVASIFGPFLDEKFGSKGLYTIIFLVLAFALSWTIVILKYRKSRKAEIEESKK